MARIAAPAAVAVDLAAAYARFRASAPAVPLRWAALVTALALIPCALAFAATVIWQLRRPMRGGRTALGSVRLPIELPRAYVGAAVLGFIGTLAAMGERFGPFILLAGLALIALALSQAVPRRHELR